MLEESKESEDPHVERLLEAFAFLAARVHLKLDDDFPEITEAFLGIVYPHFIRPIPSMSIVEFRLDMERGKLTTGLKIDRGTVLYSRPVGGVPCKFRTCYDTTLWPVTVNAAEWTTPDQLRPPLRASDSAYALRLAVNSAPDAPLPKLGLDRLRFHLTGENNLVHSLYELLCAKLTRIVVRDPNNPKVPPVTLPASALRPVGFAEDEGMAPYPLRSHIGYRILQEFFALPQQVPFCGRDGPGRRCGARASGTAPNSFSCSPLPAARSACSASKSEFRPRHFASAAFPSSICTRRPPSPSCSTSVNTNTRSGPTSAAPPPPRSFPSTRSAPSTPVLMRSSPTARSTLTARRPRAPDENATGSPTAALPIA